MADNLTLTMSLTDVQGLLDSFYIQEQEYCVLSTAVPSDTIILTSNDGFKLLLLHDYAAKEISDWDFNQLFVQSKQDKSYSIIGNADLLDKGY